MDTRVSGERGFTLIEMVVSVALFAIVMMVCVDVLLSMVNADRKAQDLQSVMNNLNIALDSMARSIREGNTFHCGTGDYTQAQDCRNGDTTFAFEPYETTNTPRVYSYDSTTKAIDRSDDGGVTWTAITSPEISIDQMEFYVVGTQRGDTVQPKVIIVIEGSAGAVGTSARTTFHIQTTAVQRVLDL